MQHTIKDVPALLEEVELTTDQDLSVTFKDSEGNVRLCIIDTNELPSRDAAAAAQAVIAYMEANHIESFSEFEYQVTPVEDDDLDEEEHDLNEEDEEFDPDDPDAPYEHN